MKAKILSTLVLLLTLMAVTSCKSYDKKDCEKLGIPVVKEINEGAWYYFPHVFSEDYANGWYEKMEAKQGSHNTYYAGEIMSFGDMDETVEYSRDLVERFFAD